MPKLPKLKVRLQFEHAAAEVCDFEQARERFDSPGVVVLVEGQVVSSYGELLQIAAQERYKDKEFLEMLLVPILGGG